MVSCTNSEQIEIKTTTTATLDQMKWKMCSSKTTIAMRTAARTSTTIVTGRAAVGDPLYPNKESESLPVASMANRTDFTLNHGKRSNANSTNASQLEE
jgi:hypothetical protein